MKRWAKALSVVVSAVFCGVALAQRSQSPEPPALSLMVGDAAPSLGVAAWVKGEPVGEFEEGKVYVVEFWATWCLPCKEAVPRLTAIQKKHAASGLRVVAVSVWEDRLAPEAKEQRQNVESFVAAQGDAMGYTVAFGDSERVVPAWMKAAERRTTPAVFVVDREGRVAWIGSPLDRDFARVVDAVVAGTHDLEAAAAVFRERIKAEKALKEFLSLVKQGELDGAFTLAKEHVGSAWWEDAETLNVVAWTIVDPKKPLASQDLGLALKAATRADALTGGNDPAIVDTLAKVCFDMGDLPRALALQEKAARGAKGNQFEAEIRERLEQYREASRGKGK